MPNRPASTTSPTPHPLDPIHPARPAHADHGAHSAYVDHGAHSAYAGHAAHPAYVDHPAHPAHPAYADHLAHSAYADHPAHPDHAANVAYADRVAYADSSGCVGYRDCAGPQTGCDCGELHGGQHGDGGGSLGRTGWAGWGGPGRRRSGLWNPGRRRPRRWPRRGAERGERGAVTAEMAFALPVLVLVLLLGIWSIGFVVLNIRCIDAARDVARSVARGESAEQAKAIGRRSLPNSTITITRDDSDVHVTVTTAPTHSPPLLALIAPTHLTATATLQAEPEAP